MSSKQFLLPALALALFTASPAPADAPAPASASATASASAALSASAAASASAAPSPSASAALPVYFVGPPPAEKSKVPTAAEWAASEKVELAHGASECTTARVREWFRVRCTVVHALNVQLVAGTHELYYSFVQGVTCYPAGDYNDDGYCEDRVETIFPLRRGDRRVIEITTQAGGYALPGAGVAEHGWAVISEAWPDDEPAPSISIAR